MSRPKKGDRLVYTGPYADEVVEGYPPGVVVGFREYGTKVTVRLEKDGESYADWPITETAPAGADE
jgi:hypothetical protein